MATDIYSGEGGSLSATSGDLLLLSPVSGGELGESGIFGNRLVADIEESQKPVQMSLARSYWRMTSLFPAAQRFARAYRRPAREGRVVMRNSE